MSEISEQWITVLFQFDCATIMQTRPNETKPETFHVDMHAYLIVK